jgi:hypothetical protein
MSISVLYAPEEQSAEAGLLSDLFGCPETGKLFAVHCAVIDVTPARLIDARSFRCPVCDEVVRIGRAGQGSVAWCESCQWTTEGTGIQSIPDLLTREADPHPEATTQFAALKRLATKAPRELPQTVTRDLASAVIGGSMDRFCAAQEHKEEDIRGFRSMSSDERAAMQKFGALSSRLTGGLEASAVISREARLVTGQWERAMQPPRRRNAVSSFSLQSPFTGKAITPSLYSASLRNLPLNAANFLPRVSAETAFAADDDHCSWTIRLIILNTTAWAMNVAFDIVDLSRGGSTSLPPAVRWLVRNELSVMSQEAGHIDVEVAKSIPSDALFSDSGAMHLEVIQRVRHSSDKSSAISDQVSRHEWRCRLVVERSAPSNRLIT